LFSGDLAELLFPISALARIARLERRHGLLQGQLGLFDGDRMSALW